MTPIPKPEDDGVIEFSCHLAMAANYSVVGDHNHAESELRLLLDVLKKAARDTEKIDSNDYIIGVIAAVDAIRVLAPHLIDAARKARP